MAGLEPARIESTSFLGWRVYQFRHMGVCVPWAGLEPALLLGTAFWARRVYQFRHHGVM